MQLPKQIVNYLTGIFYSFDEITCTNLSKFFENIAHDSFNRCLYRDVDWDYLLKLVITKLFSFVQGYICLDEIVIAKPYARWMEGLSVIKSPVLKRCVLAYSLIVVCWSRGPIKIPLAFRIWRPDDDKKKTELAEELLQYVKHELHIYPLGVLFDSYFGSKHMMKMLYKWGWIFCTQIRRSRKFNGTRVDKKTFRPYWTATGYLQGGIKVVVARHGRKYYCTNDLSLGHSTIRTLYRNRWSIEEIFRFTKSKLGIEQCQARSLTAQKAHFTMCFIAYTILQKESLMKNLTDYQIKSELSFQRSRFNLSALNLLIG